MWATEFKIVSHEIIQSCDHIYVYLYMAGFKTKTQDHNYM